MTAAELEISHSVELEIMINEKKTTLLTAVEKIAEQMVFLTPIRMGGKVVGFPENCIVHLLYSAENHVYCWHNVTIKAVRYEKGIYHCATLVGDAEIINRRGSYRVYVGSEMPITAFTSDGPKNIHVLMKDISETGIGFFSSETFDIGRTIRLNLVLKNNKELRLGAQIVRIQKDESRPGHLYGCRFLEKSPLLAGYLMHLQQEHQRQKMGL